MSLCCYCNLCTYPCPTDCIYMTPEYEFATTDLTQHLYHFAKKGAKFMTVNPKARRPKPAAPPAAERRPRPAAPPPEPAPPTAGPSHRRRRRRPPGGSVSGMSAAAVVFYVFAAITVGLGGGRGAGAQPDLQRVRAALCTFFGVAGLYVLLGADFLAATQLLIYVGGILVLLLFGVMLTHKLYDLDLQERGHAVPARPDRRSAAASSRSPRP